MQTNKKPPKGQTRYFKLIITLFRRNVNLNLGRSLIMPKGAGRF